MTTPRAPLHHADDSPRGEGQPTIPVRAAWHEMTSLRLAWLGALGAQYRKTPGSRRGIGPRRRQRPLIPELLEQSGAFLTEVDLLAHLEPLGRTTRVTLAR